jgi:lysylphosphatidylglycerol synthetase-like protein (DUF2156 family)
MAATLQDIAPLMHDSVQALAVKTSARVAPDAKLRTRDSVSNVAGTEALPEHLKLLEQHGNFTLGYSLFQPGLQYFQSENGLVAFERRFRCKTIVLGDPLALDVNLGPLLDDFLAVHPRPFFCGIGHETARHLSERGFNCNELGQDIRIHIPTYTLEGPKKQTLRQAWNKFQREEWVVEEWSYGENNAAQVARDITDEWRTSRTVSNAEMRFLTRPIVYEPENDANFS